MRFRLAHRQANSLPPLLYRRASFYNVGNLQDTILRVVLWRHGSLMCYSLTPQVHVCFLTPKTKLVLIFRSVEAENWVDMSCCEWIPRPRKLRAGKVLAFEPETSRSLVQLYTTRRPRPTTGPMRNRKPSVNDPAFGNQLLPTCEQAGKLATVVAVTNFASSRCQISIRTHYFEQSDLRVGHSAESII